MKATSWRLLGLLALSGIAVGWLLVQVWRQWAGTAPGVPWTAPLTLGALAAGFALAAITLRPRLRREEGHQPLDPFTAARTAVLAMAGTRTGAFLAGGYVGFAGYLLPDLTTQYRRSLIVPVVLCALAAAALSLAALWLERACRVPADDDPSGGAPA